VGQVKWVIAGQREKALPSGKSCKRACIDWETERRRGAVCPVNEYRVLDPYRG